MVVNPPNFSLSNVFKEKYGAIEAGRRCGKSNLNQVIMEAMMAEKNFMGHLADAYENYRQQGGEPTEVVLTRRQQREIPIYMQGDITQVASVYGMQIISDISHDRDYISIRGNNLHEIRYPIPRPTVIYTGTRTTQDPLTEEEDA